MRRWSRRCGCSTTRSTPRSPTRASIALTASRWTRPTRAWASSPRARATSTCCRRSTTSASTQGTPAMIARVIAARIAKFYTSPIVEARLKFLEAKEAALARPRAKVARIPYFCSGCPHNTSTRVPEGSKALAGIGCHYMAIWIRPDETMTFTQMGGEGAPWIGIAPFTQMKHVFANLGDGTYFHSGLLAIRAAVAANVNITYKILFNDAVAMTGGQPVDGSLNVPMITRQVAAEGAKRVVGVADEAEKYESVTD